MKVGVISDTHDRLPTLARALAMFKRLEVEAVLHAGDYVAPFAAKMMIGPASPCESAPGRGDGVPLHCIFGNNDGERAGLGNVLPQLQDGPARIELGGVTIAMHHFIDWFDPADLEGVDVVISGHNHEASIEHHDGRLHINPGECCGWLTDRCTVAILDTAGPAAELVEVHE